MGRHSVRYGPPGMERLVVYALTRRYTIDSGGPGFPGPVLKRVVREMSIVVQKFGGTSVADVEKIKNVARRVAEAKKRVDHIVVVVSALGDTTDELVSLSRAISGTPPEREMDMLLSTGEQVSMALLAMALVELGQDAISMTGQQVEILTDTGHTRAKIRHVGAERVVQELRKGRVVVVAGFQGVTTDGEITTLGRGARTPRP